MTITADPSTWPAPHYVNPPSSRQPMLLGVNNATTLLMVLFITCRLYSRSILKKRLSTDDYVMAVAAVFALAIGIVCNIITIHYGNGHHIYDFRPEWTIPYGKLTVAVNIIFPTAVSLTKISLCLLYLRLFPTQTNQYFCYGVITFLTLWCIAVTLTNILQCIPLASYFDPSITKKKCINWRASLLSTAALNSSTDLIVYLWPAVYIMSIQYSLKRRIGLIFTFCTGVIVCVAGLLRLYWCLVYFRTWDKTWEASMLWMLGSTEINIGVICGCLSGVKPILTHFFPRYFGPSAASSERNPRIASFILQSFSSSRKTARRFSSVDNLNSRNHAWASVGDESETRELNRCCVIEVTTAVDVDNSSSKGPERKEMDGCSEEWMIGGGDQK